MSSRKSTKVIVSDHTTEITVRTGTNEFSKSCIWVESNYFYGTKHSRGDDRYLIVGFDTEFKTPDEALTPDDIKDGLGKYKVLSYQFHCSIYDPDQPEAEEWSGICYSQDGERLKLSDILTFAFHEGISKGAVKKLPNKVYLAGHFTRADFPALADFQTLTELIASVRATFLSIDNCIPIQYFLPDGGSVKVDVVIRDTMLLTPATSKSLRALGELVGVEKITLDADPEKELFYKQNMDVLLAEKPDLFDRYAINDAVICVRYLEQLIGQCEAILGKRKVPATLTGIGVDLLMNTWKNDGFNPLEMIGKEAVTHSYFNKRLGRHFKKDVVVYQQEVSWHVDLATECYHGGRNEQFWFGPAFEDNWTDYDLAGAYPTAMALIGTADWRGIRVSLDLKDYTPTTLGMANIEFEFPESIRFPTLPVRTSNGLVFPRTGRSDCAAPEIALAVSLGAKVAIRHGVIIPTNRDEPAFGNFISQCIHKRKSYPKGSLQNLFWKELSNSSYGKTAQGLHHKRVYDLRDRDTKPLPESKITNPFFAAYITSFVRSALGEIMNSLPPEVCVFSCTTDGFLTNATQAQIDRASSGPIADLYRQSRETLTGDPTMLEIKHTVRKPLGWRTRGQATLIEGRPDSGGANIVLAKGGIYTPEYIEDQRALNDLIVKMFLDRSPDDRIPLKIKTGIRDIVEFDADLVDKHVSKRLNMEFDWKRMPYAVWQDEQVGHVAFSTQPWESVDDFVKVRQHWESFAVVTPRCIKTKEDYAALATYIFSQSALEEGGAAYLKKQAPDIKRLRQMLCIAWKRSAAGITRKFDGHSDASFADLLTSIGIPCKRTDVENARKPFLPHMCPPTSVVVDALERLKAIVPSLETDLFLSKHRPVDILAATNRRPLLSALTVA